ncbi:gasdermin-E-like [Toxotes jaculatrix]|uniref:gasdermin-E-like n=1 Tax=Toxotes jaculatrix TaxID=941984 RepID=UPI001B3AAF7D|nr:gasdermin-E-like [Toxotes jaculatrix]XP_040909372.1 gasdermin-E-like [Toxotes jaculatrix]
MFSKATANFVRQIDPEGSLIHVSRINDSHKLVPMALVVKRNRIWYWQRPKYQPTDFTLSDVLQGDKVLSPGVSETADFLTYQGTFGDKLSGKLNTKAGSASITVMGQGSSKLQSCFGNLRKEELDVKKLLCDSSSRLVNMQHVLLQQLEKQADVLAVVKERILTTNSCSVTHSKMEQCTFQGVLGLVGMLGRSLKVCVKDTNNIEMDSNISLEIPAGTVIAYSILELEIKKDGRYDICLQPSAIGGFETDSSLDVMDSMCIEKIVPQKAHLQNGSQEMDLSPLAELPQLTQQALFKKLQETIKDRAALSLLQCMLEDELSEPSSESSTECSQFASADHLNAAHLLVTAMEVLPDETLSLLSESSADFLDACDTLMCRLKESNGPLAIQCLPVLLQDNQAFQRVEQLLSSTSVTLKRDTDRVWTETEDKASVLPFLLCLSIHGLSLLCSGLK